MTDRRDKDRVRLDVWDLVIAGRSAELEIDRSTLEAVESAWGKPDSRGESTWGTPDNRLTGWARYGRLMLSFDGARLRQVEIEIDFCLFAWAKFETQEGPLTLDFGPGSVLVKGREYERFAKLPILLEWLPKEATVSFSFDRAARRVWVYFAKDNRWGHLGFAATSCLTREGFFDIDYYCATVRVGRN
jgi:hypothetical protein